MFVTANAGSRQDQGAGRPDRAPLALRARSHQHSSASPTQGGGGCSAVCSKRLGGWCVADDAKLAAELKRSGPAARSSRERVRFSRKSLKRRRAVSKSKPSTRSANVCWRAFRRSQRPAWLRHRRRRRSALCSATRAKAGALRWRPARSLPPFAKAALQRSSRRTLDRLAMRRAEFHRFAQNTKANCSPHRRSRERHGATQTRRDYARAFLARWQWANYSDAAAKLWKAASMIGTGERLHAIPSTALSETIIPAPCLRALPSR